MHTALQHIQAPVPNEKRLCRLTRQRKEVKHPGCLNPTHHLHRTLYTSFCTAAFHKPHKAASLSFPPHKAACSCKCACCPDAKVPYTLQSHAHTLYKPHKAASLTFPRCTASPYSRAARATPSGCVSLAFLGLLHTMTRGGVRFTRDCKAQCMGSVLLAS